MTSADNDRRILHSAIESACGERPAEILMEHLPPAGWRDLATKEDLALARSDIQIELEKLRAEIYVELEKLRAELHLGLEKLRTELIDRIEQGFRSQTWKLIGALIASQSTTIAAIALFVR